MMMVEHREETEIEWFTTKEAAAYLRTTTKALLQHVARGRLKPDHFGGRGRFKSHRFRRATLDAFAGGKPST